MTDFYYDGWISDSKTQRIPYHSAVATNQGGDTVWDTDDPGTMYIQPVIQDYEPVWYGRWMYEVTSSTFKCALLHLPQFLYCLGDTYHIKLWKDEFVFDFPAVKYDQKYHDLVTLADDSGVHYWYRKQEAA